MENVVQLTAYRQKTRKAFLVKHGVRLERFISRFVAAHIDVDFREIAHHYQEGSSPSDQTWDYVHFREVLAEAFDTVFGKRIYDELQAEFWFDRKLISKDEIIERCLSAYIMGNTEYAILIGR